MASRLNVAGALALAFVVLGCAPNAAHAQMSGFMRDGLPQAEFVHPYSSSERAAALQAALNLPDRPRLGASVSLTPNSPHAADGSRLHFWKTSFLVGSDNGGEAGVNFWGLHNEGHINVGFTPRTATARVLDCRLISNGPVTYKIFVGANEALSAEGESALRAGHFLLVVPVATPDVLISVELWPTPLTEPMGFLGCDIAVMR